MATTITYSTGPYGHGDYRHTCYSTAWCCEAGGIGIACGGTTTYNGKEVR